MPLALVSNDDGIGSFHLRALVEALCAHFEVVVAAPKREQSWIGRAMSRRTPVEVREHKGLPCRAWSVDGTPSDCINIAMQHLLPQKPDIVVSGINIGYNAGIPFILSSGTLGAAIEGAVWNVRAMAASMKVPQKHFAILHERNDFVPTDLEPEVRAAATHAATCAAALVKAPLERYVVHNLNYPEKVAPDTPEEFTVPSAMQPQSLFERSEDGVCTFRFNSGIPVESALRTDQDCMRDGTISHGILDFSRLGRMPVA